MSAGGKLSRIFLIFVIFSVSNAKNQHSRPLNGKHLNIFAANLPVFFYLERNATNHVIQSDGVLHYYLSELSESLNFSYYYIPSNTSFLEDLPFSRGAISYLINNETDYILSAAVGTASRFKKVDFPSSWFEGPFGCIVPYPGNTMNVTATIKPFSFMVWILIAVAIVSVITYLSLLAKNKLLEPKVTIWNCGSTWRVTLFVLGNLVSQGQNYQTIHLAFRVAAGAWCCGCFFIVQIYSSTLTSHLTSPNQKPIANSLQELIKVGASLTVDKGLGLDVLLQSTESGIFKRLSTTMKQNQKLRCNSTDDCLETVRTGYAGYANIIPFLKLHMGKDLNRTGTCRYYLMKDTFLYTSLFTLLPKNSPYTEIMSIGTLRLKQAGLIDYWVRRSTPTALQCMELNRNNDKTRRLSIIHMSSAFVILLVGYLFSVTGLFFEKMVNNLLYHDITVNKSA